MTLRSRTRGRTSTVAVALPDLGSSMSQQVLRGVIAAAAKHGLVVMVAESGGDPSEEADVVLAARQRADALILAAPRMPQDMLLDLLPRLEPVVVLDRSIPDRPAPAIDYSTGVRALVDHLVDHGHRELVYLAGPPVVPSQDVRAAAVDDAIRRHPFLQVKTLQGGSTIDDGYRVADDVLESRATAVLAFNDLVAFGVLARLNETGVAVPGDISVTGFDNIELALFATPPLTTAACSPSELGRRALARLAQTMAGATGGLHAAPVPDLIEPTLVPRASTGPVPPARRLGTPSSNTAGVVHRSLRQDVVARWTPTDDGAVLEGFETPLTRYVNGGSMPRVHSPRPYLHPVQSLAGRTLTQVSPRDHRHHYGISMAVPDVNGTSYWGGRTFLRGQGSALLSNHGRQVSTELTVDESGSVLIDALTWVDHQGRELLLEQRELTAVLIPEVEGWVIGWHSTLTAPTGATIASPAANGRPGAGYGGIFWRLPLAEYTETVSPNGSTESDAHGARSHWIALNSRTGSSWASVVLIQDTDEPLPWFVRASDYVGAGPSLAWDSPRVLSATQTFGTSLLGLVVDRRLPTDDAADLADLALARIRSARSVKR
jgi:LacI family transcriptional regulator